jgi:hypothetical protein
MWCWLLKQSVGHASAQTVCVQTSIFGVYSTVRVCWIRQGMEPDPLLAYRWTDRRVKCKANHLNIVRCSGKADKWQHIVPSFDFHQIFLPLRHFYHPPSSFSKSALCLHLSTKPENSTLLFIIVKAEYILIFIREKSAWSRFSEANGLIRYIVNSVMLLWAINSHTKLCHMHGLTESDSTHPREWMPAFGDGKSRVRPSTDSRKREW